MRKIKDAIAADPPKPMMEVRETEVNTVLGSLNMNFQLISKFFKDQIYCLGVCSFV